MAGHSKWSNIQHRKNAQDAKRSKIFTKLIRGIKSAVKKGDPNPETNSHLRNAIDKALSYNLPKDRIERAIGSKDDDTHYDEIRYEGYGPGGTAVMVDCLTDNKNRTVAEIRHTFTKHGGNMGTDGSVSYLFNKTGIIGFENSADEEKIMEIAIESGAEDIDVQEDGQIEITTTPEQFNAVKAALIKSDLEPTESDITMIASTSVEIDDLELAEKIMKLNAKLEDCDDVQDVYMNVKFSDDISEKLV